MEVQSGYDLLTQTRFLVDRLMLLLSGCPNTMDSHAGTAKKYAIQVLFFFPSPAVVLTRGFAPFFSSSLTSLYTYPATKQPMSHAIPAACKRRSFRSCKYKRSKGYLERRATRTNMLQAFELEAETCFKTYRRSREVQTRTNPQRRAHEAPLRRATEADAYCNP